ncbi:MAG: sulfotransferase [Pirellulaceae bacterium]
MHLDFVVPGFSKCGTTTLCALLADHPQIFIPHEKELGYFAQWYERGFEWYSDFFRNATPDMICGEGSTPYSSNQYAETACDRILERFPETRFIFIARDPIRRLESSYREMHHSGHKYNVCAEYDIGSALTKMPNMIADTHYWKLINVFRNRVPDHRILGIFLEDLHQDPRRELQRSFEFLGVDASVGVDNVKRQLNPASAKKYDSRLMRYIRTHRWASSRWYRVPIKYRERLERWLRLCRPFKHAIPWDAATLANVERQIGDEMRAFLRFFNKPADFWPPITGRGATNIKAAA